MVLDGHDVPLDKCLNDPVSLDAGEIKVIVDGSSGDDVWFAYDTISFPSRVKINQ